MMNIACHVFDTQPTEHEQVGYIQHSALLDPVKLRAFLPDAYQEWLFRARDNVEQLRFKDFITQKIGSWTMHTPESNVFAMLGHHQTWAVLVTGGEVANSDTKHVLNGQIVDRDQAEYEAQEARRQAFRDEEAAIQAKMREMAIAALEE